MRRYRRLRAACACCGAIGAGPIDAFGPSFCRACAAPGADPIGIWFRRQARAWLIVQQAIRSGLLSSPRGQDCADCARPAKFYDHRSYMRPLDVAPVCHSCNCRRGPALDRPTTTP